MRRWGGKGGFLRCAGGKGPGMEDRALEGGISDFVSVYVHCVHHSDLHSVNYSLLPPMLPLLTPTPATGIIVQKTAPNHPPTPNSK